MGAILRLLLLPVYSIFQDRGSKRAQDPQRAHDPSITGAYRRQGNQKTDGQAGRGVDAQQITAQGWEPVMGREQAIVASAHPPGIGQLANA
jgi:hypothetical protein